MAEQGEWSGPPLNARRGGFRRAATVTLRKEQMKTAAAAPRLHERHRAPSRRRASGRGVGRTTAVPMRVGLLGVDLRLRVHRPEGAETSLRNVLLGATGIRLVGTRRGAEDRTQTWRTFLTNHVRDHDLVLRERHLRRIHLARKTARRRLPELGDGRMMISLNWWLDETVAKAIYAHSASEALDRGYPPPVVDAGVLAQLFSTLLVEHGLDFYTNKFSFGNFHEEVACFLSETWDNLWSEVREELDELRF